VAVIVGIRTAQAKLSENKALAEARFKAERHVVAAKDYALFADISRSLKGLKDKT